MIPILDTNENVSRIAVIQRNISQLEDANQKVEKSRNDFITIFENAPDIIAIHADSKFLFINKKGIELVWQKAKGEWKLLARQAVKLPV